jgi:primosomal protein N' (replication factor Y)
VRALVRFDYADGRAVAEALRAAVVAEALSGRRNPKTAGPRVRNTLRVRVDVPDPEL